MHRSAILAALLGALCCPLAALAGEAAYALVDGPRGPIKASLFSRAQGALPIAQVGDRVVTLSELAAALGETHKTHRAGSGRESGKKDFTPVLERLIGARLVVQEALAIGLDETDEFKKELAAQEAQALRERLQRIALGPTKADPRDVKRLYRDLTREWKVRSARFDKQADAEAALAGAAGGGVLAGEVGYFAPRMGMLPQVLEAVRALEPGQLSGVIRIAKGFTVLRLEGVRYRDDAEARVQARQQALELARSRRLKVFYDGLVKRYVAVDQEIFAALDFEADEPGFAALEKDARVLATIEGGAPVTVADLAAAVKESFFHGVAQAVKEKRINAKKAQYLDSLLSRRLVAAEVERRKLAGSAEHLAAVSAIRDSLLFDLFVERVVIPEVKVEAADLEAYYREHSADYSYPGFYRLQGLAFRSASAARVALEKLKAGIDLEWLKRNAEAQAAPGAGVLELDGSTVSANALPPELAGALAGAQGGDLRLLERKGVHYVIAVKQVTPPHVQPLAEVREIIAPKARDALIARSLDEWIKKLRQAHDVRVFITRIVS